MNIPTSRQFLAKIAARRLQNACVTGENPRIAAAACATRNGRTLLALGLGLSVVSLSHKASAQTTYNWNQTTTPNTWSLNTNWTPTAPVGGPDAAGTIAIINTNITANLTINLFNTGDAGDATKTVGRLDIGDTNSTAAFIVAAGSGSGVLDFNNSGAGAQLNRLSTGSASDSITANVTLSDNLAISNAANVATALITGTITAATSGLKTLTNFGAGTGTVTLSGAIGNGLGTVAVTQNSANSALTLTGANDYSGTTTVSAGTLNIGSGTTTAGLSVNTSVVLGNSATFRLNSTSGQFISNAFSLTGTNTIATISTANTSGNTEFSGAFTADSTQTLKVGGTAQVNFKTTTQNLGNLGTLDIVSGATLRYSTTTGASNTGGANTTFNVDGFLTARNAVGTAGSITNGIHLGALTGAGSILGGGSTTAGTDNWIIGEKNVSSSTFTGTIANGTGANLSTSSITKLGTGTQTFAGASTYTGATTISGGILKAGIVSTTNANGAFGLNSAVSLGNTSGVSMDITGFDTQIGSLAGGGTTGGNVILGAATLTIGGTTNAANMSYAGVISGTGGVIKAGTGNQTLTGANTYAGGTTVNDAGTLTLARTNNDGVGAIRGTLTINAGATVVTSTANAIGYTAGSEVSTLNITGGTFNNTSTFDQGFNTTVNLTGGTLTTNGGASSNTTGSLFVLGKNTGSTAVNTLASATTSTIAGRLNLDISNPIATFTVAKGTTTSGTDLLVSAAITERVGTGQSVGITKAGLGTMTLTGANTYSGGTTVNAGTLLVSNTTGSATGTGSVTVNNSGSILTGTGFINASATGATITVDGTLSPGAVAATGNPGTIHLAAAGGLTLSSSSTLLFDLTSTSSKDLVALTNTSLNLGGGTLALNLPDLTATGIDYTQTYALFTGVSGLTGNFGSVTGYDSADYTPVFMLNGMEYDLTFTAVPEPGTVAAGLLALGTLGFSQRRRLRKFGYGRHVAAAAA